MPASCGSGLFLAGDAWGARRDQVRGGGRLRLSGDGLGGVRGQVTGNEHFPVRADQVEDHFLLPAAAGAGALVSGHVVLPGVGRRECARDGRKERF